MTKAALRALAVLQIVLAVKIAWIFRAQRALFDRLDHESTAELFPALERLTKISRIASWGIMALSLAALVVFAIDGKRRLARIGAFVFGAHALLVLVLQLVARDSLSPATFHWAYFFGGIAEGVGLALVLFSLGTERTGALIFVFVAVADCLIGVVSGRMKELPKSLPYLFVSAAVAMFLTFGIVALMGASKIDEPLAATAVTGEGERRGGDPLRIAAWSTLVRIGVGIVAGVFALVAMKDGDASGASSATIFGALASVIGAIALIFGLIGYARTRVGTPDAGVIGFVVVIVVIAGALDLWAVGSAVELFDQIAQAKKATSFWGMPSFTKLEALQENIRWASRAEIVLGMIAMMTTASALKGAAERTGAKEEAARAGRTRILAILAAGVSFFAGLLLEKPKAGEEVLVVALIALVLGVATLVSWIRLLYGVAHAIEHPRLSSTSDID